MKRGIKENYERINRDNREAEDEEAIYTRGRVENGLGNVYLEATARFAIRRGPAKANL